MKFYLLRKSKELLKNSKINKAEKEKEPCLMKYVYVLFTSLLIRVFVGIILYVNMEKTSHMIQQ